MHLKTDRVQMKVLNNLNCSFLQRMSFRKETCGAHSAVKCRSFPLACRKAKERTENVTKLSIWPAVEVYGLWRYAQKFNCAYRLQTAKWAWQERVLYAQTVTHSKSFGHETAHCTECDLCLDGHFGILIEVHIKLTVKRPQKVSFSLTLCRTNSARWHL